MKKKIGLLLFVLITFGCQPNHLTFKGIPIDGDRDTFGKRLEEQGFTKEDDFIPTWKGDFIRLPQFFSKAELVLQTTSDGTVYEVFGEIIPRDEEFS